MTDDDRRTSLPPLPGPSRVPRSGDTLPELSAAELRARHQAHEAVAAVGGVGSLDPWDEPEPARRDLYDRTAWIERLAWRNAFLITFMIGVFGFAFEWLAWPYAAALAVGGLAPGLFLMAREQIERNVEADRAVSRPETRHDGTLPPLRRTVRPVDDTADD